MCIFRNNKYISFLIITTSLIFRCNSKWKSSIKLENVDLTELNLIAQVDSKFVAVTLNKNQEKYLLLLDQHAMHERIRVENLQESES